MKPAVVLDLDDTLISSSLFPPSSRYLTQIHGQRVENAATNSDGILNTQQLFLKDSPTCFTIKVNRRKVYVLTRPGLQTFYSRIKNKFDVYFFTSSDKRYADQIIDFIDPQIPKEHRFYRTDCLFQYGYCIKDLSLLNRNLDEITLIDDIEGSALKQPNNLIRISPWSGWISASHSQIHSSPPRRKSENDVIPNLSISSQTGNIAVQNDSSNQHAITDTSCDEENDSDDELLTRILPLLQQFADDFYHKKKQSRNQ